MFGIGTTELILILLVVMIIFGVGKLPQVGEGLGKAMKSFKKATSEDEIDPTQEDKKKL
ncbi:MAG: twin-arginine translocase TatA/TatE family subunit [Thermodesulfobacteriota bacterium]